MTLLGTQANALRGDASQSRAPWLAITGAKGGVGKTTLAVNLALLLARAGQRTLLVDLDPGCGNVDVHLRLGRRSTLDEAIAGRCAPADAIVDGPAGLRVLAGFGATAGATAGLPTTDAAIQRAHAVVTAAAAGCDLVVLDTGAGLGEAGLATAARADLTLGVSTAEPSAITDAYAQCKLLHARGRPLPRLLLNGVRSRDEAMRTAGRFAAICRRFLAAECALFGWLRRDAELERSTQIQRPFATHGSGPALDELQALAAAALSALPPLPRRQALPAAVLLRREAARAAV